MPRLISKRVRVIDCNCSDRSVQGDADRFDFCVCKVRTQKGKRGAVVDLPEKHQIGTVFIAAHPKKAFRE